MLRICVNSRPAFIASVHTMRARICSAISCDMFARVVWLNPWGAAKPPIFALSFAAHTCHARLARLTRARGGRYVRGRKALLHDFWYFWSCKSTIKEKLFYVSIGSSRRRPLQAKIQVQPRTKIKNICFIPCLGTELPSFFVSFAHLSPQFLSIRLIYKKQRLWYNIGG